MRGLALSSLGKIILVLVATIALIGFFYSIYGKTFKTTKGFTETANKSMQVTLSSIECYNLYLAKGCEAIKDKKECKEIYNKYCS